MPPSAEPKSPEPAIVDCRGQRCPWPVLRAQRAMRQGLPFTLLADDPLAGTDVPAIARLQGWIAALRSNEGDLLRFDLEPGNSAHRS